MVDVSKKWKRALLRTSLPLELLVSEVLTDTGLFVGGTYPYQRENETGLVTEFSVDVHAFELLEKKKRGKKEPETWGQLSLLVECKYSYPGVRWVFAPHTNPESVVVGSLSIFQDITTLHVDTDPCYAWEFKLQHCTKGIELHRDDANPQAIERGRSQLQYAIPKLVLREVEIQLGTFHDEDLLVGFVCPILVTTADLFVLQRSLSLEDFENADDISQVAERTDAVVLYQEPSPQQFDYVDAALRSFLKRNPTFPERIKRHGQLLDASRIKDALPPTVDRFGRSVINTTSRVLVVNYSAFPKYLKILRRAVNAAGRKARRYARLEREAGSDRSQVIAL